jgi:methylamine dehydrogenase accessory protein MauD
MSVETALIASNVLLWIALVVLALVVLALTRQVGVLLERVAPAGALVLGQGLRAGERVPEIALTALDGTPRHVGGKDADGRGLLLLFVAPACPVCASLLPALEALARHERKGLRVLLASDGDEDHLAYAQSKGIHPSRYVVSRELGLRFGVGRLPHAALIDADGVLRASGLVNSREHLESLLEAQRLGVASLQELAHRNELRVNT